jgi:hypothetical protein
MFACQRMGFLNMVQKACFENKEKGLNLKFKPTKFIFHQNSASTR